MQCLYINHCFKVFLKHTKYFKIYALKKINRMISTSYKNILKPSAARFAGNLGYNSLGSASIIAVSTRSVINDNAWLHSQLVFCWQSLVKFHHLSLHDKSTTLGTANQDEYTSLGIANTLQPTAEIVISCSNTLFNEMPKFDLEKRSNLMQLYQVHVWGSSLYLFVR